MNPRGVTLVELLAAVSILVVVTALSLPAVQSRLAGARMEAAQGQVEAAVLAARAEAMRSGRALELLARAGRDGEVELIIRPVKEGLSTPEKPARGVESERRPRTGSVWCQLPKGVIVSDRDQESGEASRTSKPAAPREGPADADSVAPSGDVRIAVFCPDGTALGSATATMSDGDSELAIRVNEWIGGASLSPVAAEATQEGAEESPVKAEEIPKPSGAVR